MTSVTVYLQEELRQYASRADLNLSGLLQEAIKAHQAEHDDLERMLQVKLDEYRDSPERRAEWESKYGPDEPFKPCPTCGVGVDEAEGCLTMFEPYDAAPVALLAHFPRELRHGMLKYWQDSGYTDVPMGPV